MIYKTTPSKKGRCRALIDFPTLLWYLGRKVYHFMMVLHGHSGPTLTLHYFPTTWKLFPIASWLWRRKLQHITVPFCKKIVSLGTKSRWTFSLLIRRSKCANVASALLTWQKLNCWQSQGIWFNLAVRIWEINQVGARVFISPPGLF